MLNSRWIDNLQRKIENHTAKIGIIGLGYVGLPLALLFSKKYRVYGFDVDTSKIDSLKHGKSYIVDVKDEEIVEALNKNLSVSAREEILESCDVYIITVPTPLHENGEPNMDYVISAGITVSKFLEKGNMVILESTVYPGATKEVLVPILEKGGMIAGEDFAIVFSPERVNPGNKKYTVEKTPKVVGGINKESTNLAVALYSSVLDAQVIPVKDCKTAEAVKVLENAFRFINISFINEMALIFESMGIDIWEVIDAASTKPIGFMPHYPGPGVGGHCIPIDPIFLLHRMWKEDRNSGFISLAQEINNIMPYHTVNLLRRGIKKIGRNIKNAKILLLGIAYKPNIADVRESPALKIMDILDDEYGNWDFYDTYINVLRRKGKEIRGLKKINLEIVKKYDALILITPHRDMVEEIREILSKLNKKIVIVDGRNSLEEFREKHIYLGIGKPEASE